MLKHLKISNVGPAPVMELELGKRLNLLTGDNGLGKSFLLDIAWWALTRRWPAELNKRLPTGFMARPHERGEATIDFSFTAKTKREVKYQSRFDRQAQAWVGKAGRPSNPGLVLYAQVDGSFSVWDPARNYWRKRGSLDVQERPPAYVFSPHDVWNGLVDEERGLLCNGLILDWAGWQKEKSIEFHSLCKVLSTLSPGDESMEPGELARISLDDPRDIPTLKMPYGSSVPILYASAGVRRILAIAYLLVWSWKEHKTACQLLDQPTTSQVIFLIDEIEAHLHPKWQRCIVHALLEVVDTLVEQADVQLIAATHSPLVMASVEPMFDAEQDSWFDLDLVKDMKVSHVEPPQVQLTQRPFVRRGDASFWLTSEAFDLQSARSLEAEQVLQEASKAMDQENFGKTTALDIDNKLRKVLGDTDPFWLRWRFVAEKKGWLS